VRRARRAHSGPSVDSCLFALHWTEDLYIQA